MISAIYTDDVRQDICAVNDYIKKALKTNQRLLYDAVSQLVEAGGKRLRPLLMILSSRFGNCSRDDIVPLAAIIEIIHMATLIHDDIIDDSAMRRGSPTIQARWGKDVAVFTGDFLLSAAFSLLSREVSFDELYWVSKVIRRLCEGEVDQYQHRYNVNVSVRSYLRRIKYKTADLFALSCAIGARKANCDKKICNALQNFGVNFGMAFQITDDILDFEGDEKDMGKPSGADFEEGVYTLPLIYALETEYCYPLLNILNKDNYDIEDVQKVKAMVRASGGIGRAQAMARRFIDKAADELEILPDNDYKQILYDMLCNIIDRKA